MKFLILIVLTLASGSIAGTYSLASESKIKPNLKWLRAGYEVAKAHWPDREIAGHIVYENCGEDIEFWEPKAIHGRGNPFATSNFKSLEYQDGSDVSTVYYRCKKIERKSI